MIALLAEAYSGINLGGVSPPPSYSFRIINNNQGEGGGANMFPRILNPTT